MTPARTPNLSVINQWLDRLEQQPRQQRIRRQFQMLRMRRGNGARRVMRMTPQKEE